MPKRLSERLVSWASILDPQTEAQARATSELPIVEGHIALMPDAHLGKGATIGSVIPTRSAVIPSAVGVDIGCGMAARRLDLRAEDLGAPELEAWVRVMGSAVPGGLGRWHRMPSDEAEAWFEANQPSPRLDKAARAMAQLGSLGSGNHFIELAADTDRVVWILLHSGSRGGGEPARDAPHRCRPQGVYLPPRRSRAGLARAGNLRVRGVPAGPALVAGVRAL
jgi:tRNA-splicing ligase RtcB (3'-phosphate/5'-hydroxy nucleic acid ligase)